MNTITSPNYATVEVKSIMSFYAMLNRTFILSVVCVCNLSAFIQRRKNNAVRLLLMIFLLAGSISLSGQPKDTLKHHFKVGVRERFEPYAFVNENKKPDGLVVDLLHEIEKSSNITFELIPMTYNGTIDALDNAKVDIICLVNSPDRAQQYNFSSPLCEIKQAIYQKERNLKSIQLNSLTGYKIGFIEDDVLLDTFANRTDFEKVIVLSKLDGFLHLEHNQIDAFFCGEQNGIKLLSEYDFQDIKLVTGNLFPRDYTFVTSKNNQQIIQLLNKQLAKLQTSGTLLKLNDKWLSGEQYSTSWIKKHQTLLITILGIFTFLIILLLFWNWLLRSMVYEKTKSIKESETKYRELVDHSPDAIAIYVDGIIVFVNDECIRLMHAVNAGELIGKNVIEFIHPDNRAFIIERMKKASTQDAVLPLAEEKLIRSDNSVVDVEVKDMPIKYENKPAVQLIVRDITERKKAELALQESEKRFNTLFMDSPDAYLLIVDGVFVDCNRTAEKLLLGDRTQIIGLTPDAISAEFQPDGRKSSEVLAEKFNYTLQHGNATFDWIHRRFDGADLYVEVSLASINLNGKQTLFTTWRDISKRKQAEESLQNERLLLRTLIDNIPDLIYIKDLSCKKILANMAEVEFLGVASESEVLGKDDFEFYPKEIAEKFKFNDQLLLQTGELDFNAESYIFDSKGNKHCIISTRIPLRDKNNQIIGLLGIGRNITSRKIMEESLRLSEENYRTLVELMPDGVYKSSSEGKFISVNEALVKMLGYDSKEELMDIDIETQLYFDKSDREKMLSTSKSLEIRIYRLKRKDGSGIWVEDHGWYILNDEGDILFHEGVMRDVTGRLQDERDLNKSREELKNFAAHLQTIREEERLQLANEIHDEVGQILIAIKIDMGILKQKTLKVIDRTKSDEILPKFDSLLGLIDNTINTTRKIMTDNRQEVLHLLGFVESAKLQVSTFQDKYQINCRFESSITNLEVNSHQSIALFRILQEALSNIVKHAQATEVKVVLLETDNNLVLEIIDNGIGFVEKLETKRDAYGFIGMKERAFLLDGELFISSQLGKGTSVKVVFPYMKDK